MYKVLDVREHKYAVARSCGTGSNYSSSVSVTNDIQFEFVVICMELATKERKDLSFMMDTKRKTSFGERITMAIKVISTSWL